MQIVEQATASLRVFDAVKLEELASLAEVWSNDHGSCQCSDERTYRRFASLLEATALNLKLLQSIHALQREGVRPAWVR